MSAAAVPPAWLRALEHLAPGVYGMVLGLCGLSLAWLRAVPLMGDTAAGFALALGALAGLVFGLLALATLLRWRHHPAAWAADRKHPVRHTFVATLSSAIILLVTVAVALFGPSPALLALWRLGALAHAGVTLWVLARWWRPAAQGGLVWASVTPVLFIPAVGNVLVPLAGVPLGQWEWSAAQFGVGLLFWPLVLGLLAVRLLVNGAWPERLLPSNFILIAPPAIGGLGALQLGAPALVAWAAWGVAAFTLAWVAPLLARIAKLPFGLAHWAMTFPLAGLTTLTLRLATPGGPLAVLGPAMLAATSLLVAALLLATLRGLRDGSLLVPETVAVISAG